MDPTHHSPPGAEVGMALQGAIQGVLSDISKHFIMQFVHCAVGNSTAQA